MVVVAAACDVLGPHRQQRQASLNAAAHHPHHLRWPQAVQVSKIKIYISAGCISSRLCGQLPASQIEFDTPPSHLFANRIMSSRDKIVHPPDVIAPASELSKAVHNVVHESSKNPFIRIAKQLSFKSSDEFFHGMLSYRVRAEGPSDKGGNNLALLIHEACCSDADISTKRDESSSKSSSSQSLLRHALGNFGKWPKAFSGKSETLRIFLDQVNLRMGLPWKGTGDADGGGFLGAVSRALLLVPLFSATPVRFKIISADCSSQKYALKCPINVKLTAGTELLSIERDEITGHEIIRGHLCGDIQSDGSFDLSDVPSGPHTNFPGKFEFCCVSNFLPSDGTGPVGSLADMLTLQQKPEELTFTVVSHSEGRVILEAEQLSDHVFFPSEMIFLRIADSSTMESFEIQQVVCQGSKDGKLLSKIRIDCLSQTQSFANSSSPIYGVTVAMDRSDNFLMELMLSRALRTEIIAEQLHPCKFIMPVFVDDIDTLYALSRRLSDTHSSKTSAAVRNALETILKRKLTSIEEGQWILVSVKDVVTSFFDFQGVQLSDKANRYKSMTEKASFVRTHIIATAGMEACNNDLHQYVANNPLALELRDFLESNSLLHMQPVLVKHDITSVKEFSLLHICEIRSIAQHSHELSSRPLIKEIVEISRAVNAAQSSDLILPVSRRLELFEDKESSFLTVIYSSNAITLALQKPFFALGFQSLFFALVFSIGVYQVYEDPVGNLPHMLPNATRALWMLTSMFCLFVLKSVKAAFRSYIFWSFITSVSYFAGFIIDKVDDGSFHLDLSKDCAGRVSSQLDISRYKFCVHVNYVFFGFSAFFYLVLEYCLLLRQNIVWKCVAIGFTVQYIIATALNPNMYTYLGCTLLPLMLFMTEVLRFYGKVQASEITKFDTFTQEKKWSQVLAESLKDLEEISQKLSASFDTVIVDRSTDVGEWDPAITVSKALPPIHQPIKNIDDLYNVACELNTTFQAWIASYFLFEASPAMFLYDDGRETCLHSKHSLHRGSFQGTVQKGPVKRPQRAIAKVHDFIPFYL
jgi:hypothetical protein